MSATAALAVRAADRTKTPANAQTGHRLRLYALYTIAVATNLAIFIYGFDYYKLSAVGRPFSPKHHLLRPSGTVGLFLGFAGAALFIGIFLYPIRKHWPWLGKIGSTRHWLDIHVFMGLTAPFVIALHSSLKFKGIAGMAFWIMLAVSASGVVGRYLYAQIPRKVSTAELSMKELQELQAKLVQQLAGQNLLPARDLQALLRMPDRKRVSGLPILAALVYMLFLDVVRVFLAARLRRHSVSGAAAVKTLGGLLPTGQTTLEEAIRAATEQAVLSKRVLFLSRSRKVFQLWHVVHKPFSYAFAVLALLHVGLQFALGYF